MSKLLLWSLLTCSPVPLLAAFRPHAAAAAALCAGARGARGGRAAPPAPADTPASRLAAAKETLALAAQTFLGSPERHLAQLHEIVALCSAKDPLVARLALVTAAAVLADVVPGYRIRPPTERELEVVVSREVQALRDYEQGLLRQYQRYLRAARAALAAGRAGGAALPHARVAARCMGRLLVAAPHFNYTTDLLQALVPVATSRDPELRFVPGGCFRCLGPARHRLPVWTAAPLHSTGPFQMEPTATCLMNPIRSAPPLPSRPGASWWTPCAPC